MPSFSSKMLSLFNWKKSHKCSFQDQSSYLTHRAQLQGPYQPTPCMMHTGPSLQNPYMPITYIHTNVPQTNRISATALHEPMIHHMIPQQDYPYRASPPTPFTTANHYPMADNDFLLARHHNDANQHHISPVRLSSTELHPQRSPILTSSYSIHSHHDHHHHFHHQSNLHTDLNNHSHSHRPDRKPAQSSPQSMNNCHHIVAPTMTGESSVVNSAAVTSPYENRDQFIEQLNLERSCSYKQRPIGSNQGVPLYRDPPDYETYLNEKYGLTNASLDEINAVIHQTA